MKQLQELITMPKRTSNKLAIRESDVFFFNHFIQISWSLNQLPSTIALNWSVLLRLGQFWAIPRIFRNLLYHLLLLKLVILFFLNFLFQFMNHFIIGLINICKHLYLIQQMLILSFKCLNIFLKLFIRFLVFSWNFSNLCIHPNDFENWVLNQLFKTGNSLYWPPDESKLP